MENNLTATDIEMIAESLRYTKLKFEEYDKYPSSQYRQLRVGEVNAVLAKINQLRKELQA